MLDPAAGRDGPPQVEALDRGAEADHRDSSFEHIRDTIIAQQVVVVRTPESTDASAGHASTAARVTTGENVTLANWGETGTLGARFGRKPCA